MPVRATIWDMDGVIVDSGLNHLASWQFAFARRGVQLTAEDFQQLFGQRNDNIIRSVMGQDVDPLVIPEIARDKEVRFRELISGNIKAFPGVLRLIGEINRSGFKLAIASSAPIENIRLILNGFAIADYFHVIVTGQEVAESKPSPLIFLRAAEKLDVAPGDAIVFEDAVAGVIAAKRAGMLCVAVTNTNSAGALAAADIVVDSLEDVSVSSLQKLLKATPQKGEK